MAVDHNRSSMRALREERRLLDLSSVRYDLEHTVMSSESRAEMIAAEEAARGLAALAEVVEDTESDDEIVVVVVDDTVVVAAGNR